MEAKPWLKNLKPYPPGKTLEEIKRELKLEGPIYKLNSNENPLGPSPKVINALREALHEIHLYPEASYQSLRMALAQRWNLSPEEIILGNGSNEVIEFVFKAYLNPGDEVIVSFPSFLMYEKFAEIYGVKSLRIPLDKELNHDFKTIKASITSRTRAIFLDHPHNPTGQVHPRETWREFLDDLPKDILIVIDEAYGDFIDGEHVPRGIEFLKEGRQVLVLRTFSKAFGLAGLRLGYGLAPVEIIFEMNKVRQPFNVNLLAVKAGLAALQDKEYEEKYLELVRRGRNFLCSSLKALGFKVYPSQANFIMVDFGNECEKIYQNLFEKGIILRPLKAYGFPNTLRITIGTEEANHALLRVLRDTMENNNEQSAN
ncbi:MAG: histidinol-phosphate transaminase [Caldimicrobium sp.]|nr:histidinol-phosphate transaminase [Caldimicrobium sp.]MCX7613895.1 histidinol-phosphate transaminase [Caldimicrobium sp.]MDW8183445.1 histidinol-phosphate transaminase [Caldimicrobium sp.]